MGAVIIVLGVLQIIGSALIWCIVAAGGAVVVLWVLGDV